MEAAAVETIKEPKIVKQRAEKQRIKSRSGYHKKKLYMDSGASSSMLFNRELVDIKELNRPYKVACGRLVMQLNEIGSLKKVFEHLPLPKNGYYSDENMIANLLSLEKIANEFRVVMDTDIDNAIYVYGEDGKYLRFGKTENNLYCCELKPNQENKEDCFFSTVKGRKAMFSKLDCKRAAAVRELQERLGFPSDVILAKAIEYNVLGTCQYNRRDIRIANKIFGPSKGSLKGKSTARKGKMDTQDRVMRDVPPKVMNEYRNIHLDIDIMFVNGTAFLATILRHLRMTHARAILDRKINKLKDEITAVKSEYKNRGFSVKTIHGDNEFSP